jgi:hypothetical protein
MLDGLDKFFGPPWGESAVPIQHIQRLLVPSIQLYQDIPFYGLCDQNKDIPIDIEFRRNSNVFEHEKSTCDIKLFGLNLLLHVISLR